MVDHSATGLSAIPSEWITKAKSDLHIAYGHTSHGSQVTSGMTGLVSFKGNAYAWNNGGTGGALDLHDYAMPGDLGNPNYTQWEAETRTYLAANSDVNVIIWSWCGQVSSATADNINTYLTLMNGLEEDFPDVAFVYMTGHLDGTGLNGTSTSATSRSGSTAVQTRNGCLTSQILNHIILTVFISEIKSRMTHVTMTATMTECVMPTGQSSGRIHILSGLTGTVVLCCPQPAAQCQHESICRMAPVGTHCRLGR